MDDLPDRSLSDRADDLLDRLHHEESSRRDVFVLWLIALVFTTGVTAILLLRGRWQS